MNIDYYRKDSWLDSTFSKRGKCMLGLLAVVVSVGIIACGCGFLQGLGGDKEEDISSVAPVAQVAPAPTESVKVPEEEKKEDEITIPETSNMVTYDVTTIGRADPFMPSDEIQAFEEAKNSALAEAAQHNAQVLELSKLKGKVVREADDINPYSFNLPVPPTSLAPETAAAAKITRTKVVGIMYNKVSPSAIINVDDKDYLVRQGDKIIGQEYKVMQINPSWITVSLGSNVYSASIGELFSREELDKTQNDLYNLRNRFGGRKG